MLFIILLSLIFISTYYLTFARSLNRSHLLGTISTIALALFLLLAFIALTMLYYLFDTSWYFNIYLTDIPGETVLFTSSSSTLLVSQIYLSLSPIHIYYFPFGYIFVLITVLSILFCLAYNTNELSAFLLYCVIILSAGYTLFFTTSLLVFFFAYEMLLIPSFFILYNFAKTRKCVEAAYLMFF